MRGILAAAAVLLLAAAAAAQDPEKVPEAADPAKVKPGRIALLRAPKKMRYFLRVPEGYDPRAGARLIVFLHGSNMNGLAYLRSFEAKKWAEDAILLCPNGDEGTDPYGANNFAMNSAHLVADATEQVKKDFKVTVAYCGGHSQGAFLTYAVILHYPALFQGAFPVAGDCWMQNEPNLFEDRPDVARAQREIPIAVIHGRDDPVVPFSQGEHAYGCFRASGWQKLRLLAPDGIGHMFMASPVEEALAWLDAMNGIANAPAILAEAWKNAGEWGWVLAAAKAPRSPFAALAKEAEAAAAAAAPAMKAALQGKPAEWVPKWLEFWRVHGASAAAKPLVSVYLDRRQKQAAAGRHLLAEANALFRQEKRASGYAALERLLAEAPCTYEAHYAVAWLAERK